MTIRKIFLLAVAAFAAAVLAAPLDVAAAESPPIGVGLVIDNTNSLAPGKEVFLQTRVAGNIVNDNIGMTLTLQNVSAEQIVTSKGFSEAPFHLVLTFTGPDGKGIQSKEFEETPWADPPPPDVVLLNGKLEQVERVERLPADWALRIQVPNMNAFYHLLAPGRYAVQAIIPVRTYGATGVFDVDGASYAKIPEPLWEGSIKSNVEYFTLTADLDGDGYFAPEPCARAVVNNVETLVCDGNGQKTDCNDNDPAIHPAAAEPIPWNGVDHDCDPATPGTPATPSGKIVIQAVKYVVGSGHHPSCGKEPIPSLPVKVVEKTHRSCAGGYGESWRAYQGIWMNCPTVESGVTDAQGSVTFTVPEGKYMVVGLYDPAPSDPSDDIYVGKSVGEVEVNHTKKKKLHVIVTAAGRHHPGKSGEREDSGLEVIEPEYLDWTGTQALYPVIFDGEGELSATTSIHVPPGLTADYRALSVEGSRQTRAVQFTVNGSGAVQGAGSEHKDVPVEHRFRHRKKAGVLKSTIDRKD